MAMEDSTIEIGEPVIQEGSVTLPHQEPGWIQETNRLLESGSDQEIQQRLADLHESDIAHLIDQLEEESHQLRLFSLLDHEIKGLVLNELDHQNARFLLKTLSPSELALIIREMDSDDARYLLSDMDLNTISEILSRMPLPDRITITELLSYPEDSAGALMSKEFAAVNEKDTVQKSIQTLRRILKEAEDIHTIFVLDEEGRYKGHLELSRLILANPRSGVKKIMNTELIPIPVNLDREETARFFTRYDFITLPVIDDRGVMLGRITVDDILEVVEEEASEDILRMGGVSGEEDLTTTLWKASLHRVIWLSVNLATAFLAASVVSLFQGVIGKMALLAALMPIVAGMGGNAASQTMAVVIRYIALGELAPKDLFFALRRESMLGLLNGLGMGLVAILVVYIITHNLALSAVLGSALLINMIVAAAAGTIIPLTLKRLKVDPAIASSIFVTTATDVLGFFTFLGLASLFFRYM